MDLLHDRSSNTTQLMLSEEGSVVDQHGSAADIMEGVTLSAIFLLSLVGNLLVCYCGITSTRGQAMNYFIVNSALAEILLAILVLPLRIQRQFIDNSINPNLCRLLQYFQTVALGVITITFLLIAIDRYFSLFLSPMKITLRKAKYMIIISWCFPLLVTSPIFLDLSGAAAQPRWLTLRCVTHENPTMNKFNKIFSLIQISIVSILPMCLLSAIYFVMITRVLRIDTIRKSRQVAESRKSPCGTLREEVPVAKRRALVMNFIVTSLFLFCWCPIVTLYTVQVIQGHGASNSEKSLYDLLSYIAFVNLTFNPLVYCFFDSVFRNHVFCCFRYKRCPRGGNIPRTKEPLTEDKLTELTVSKIGSGNSACADQEPLLTKGTTQQPTNRRPMLCSRDKLARLVCNTRRYRSLGLSRSSDI